jgi:hypothetical protein
LAVVPYELSLAPDHDRGGHRYSAVLSGELEPEAVRQLSEWLDDAKQNPDASFLIDLSATTATSRRARTEMQALLRRHDDLQERGRLSVLRAPRRSRRAAAAAVAPAAVPFIERALTAAGSTPVPL